MLSMYDYEAMRARRLAIKAVARARAEAKIREMSPEEVREAAIKHLARLEAHKIHEAGGI